MRCHYTHDEQGVRHYIPYCWGAVNNGPDFCTCYPVKEPDGPTRKDKIQELQKEITRLNRIIRKLTKKKR